jgi:hypothetical protein
MVTCWTVVDVEPLTDAHDYSCCCGNREYPIGGTVTFVMDSYANDPQKFVAWIGFHAERDNLDVSQHAQYRYLGHRIKHGIIKLFRYHVIVRIDDCVECCLRSLRMSLSPYHVYHADMLACYPLTEYLR